MIRRTPATFRFPGVAPEASPREVGKVVVPSVITPNYVFKTADATAQLSPRQRLICDRMRGAIFNSKGVAMNASPSALAMTAQTSRPLRRNSGALDRSRLRFDLFVYS